MNLSGEDGVFLVVRVQAGSICRTCIPGALEPEKSWVSLVCSLSCEPLEAYSVLYIFSFSVYDTLLKKLSGRPSSHSQSGGSKFFIRLSYVVPS